MVYIAELRRQLDLLDREQAHPESDAGGWCGCEGDAFEPGLAFGFVHGQKAVGVPADADLALAARARVKRLRGAGCRGFIQVHGCAGDGAGFVGEDD